MSMLRTTVLATAVISTGLLSSAGMAFAGDNPGGHHHGGATVQKGLLNSSDFAPNTPVNVCGNDVPVNALGVQVPVQDNVASVPFLSEAKHGDAASSAKTCSSPIHAIN
ncbi:hypothetical protein [Actinomycetospora termitidis]|uniref:Chaplin domain-containing protein n=1 Tax=Actinomycetospora termitidis TaxID=3053470 RepID=A0ABT7MKM0_9PSEU|nr:hypothetical protein [Actinomycetospora sp. Odt1-22]MDL5159898.1 hypothetical protein [Actinomycetospora sp. Odt1-22]